MLNTENPNCFTYSTDELLIELLGGVRIDTLDRMRVTMKVSVTNRKHPQYASETADLAVRHNLDLYNDTQVEKFVRTVAERLEVGTIAIKKAIADITFQLEVYRLEQLNKREVRKEKVLSATEREEAIQFLENKNLFYSPQDLPNPLRKGSLRRGLSKRTLL